MTTVTLEQIENSEMQNRGSSSSLAFNSLGAWAILCFCAFKFSQKVTLREQGVFGIPEEGNLQKLPILHSPLFQFRQ